MKSRLPQAKTLNFIRRILLLVFVHNFFCEDHVVFVQFLESIDKFLVVFGAFGGDILPNENRFQTNTCWDECRLLEEFQNLLSESWLFNSA